MAINFLFWNIRQNPANLPLIKQMVDDFQIHILLLAECGSINPSAIEKETNLVKMICKYSADENKYSPQFYSSPRNVDLEHISTDSSLKRLVLCSLKFDNLQSEIIIGGIHFPSKMGRKDSSQESTVAYYSNFVKDIEKEQKNKKTILFGDFNMNPFESGMIKPEYFNATLSEIIARKSTQNTSFGGNDYFYNPMWSFLGDKCFDKDGIKKPFATYYFDNRTQDSAIIFYNITDGVIMRAGIIDIFDFNSLAIIDKIHDISLVNANFIPNKLYSDHLPIKFSLKI
jgi:hypothetical protein